MRRSTRTMGILSALVVLLTVGLSSAALALSDSGKPPIITNQPVTDAPNAAVDTDSPLRPEPVGPFEPGPRPEPTPDPDPAPEPVDPDRVIVLKPDQDPTTIDSEGALTGDAEFSAQKDGDEKIVLVIAGRTVDEYGNPVPGAQIEFIVDKTGVLRRLKSSDHADLERAGVTSEEKFVDPEVEFPHVRGFSDARGCFRVRVSFYARPGGMREIWIQANRDGYLPATREGIDVSSGSRSDIELQLGKAASLTGRCIDQFGNPAAGVTVYAVGGNSAAMAITDPDGKFELLGLAGGDFQISCWSEHYRFESDGRPTYRVIAGHSNTLPEDLRMSERTSLAFRMDFAGGEAADIVHGTLELYDAEGRLVLTTYFSSSEESGYSARAIADGLHDGTWTLKVSALGDKAWQAELPVAVSKGIRNDLGTIYLLENETPDPQPVPKPHPRPRRG